MPSKVSGPPTEVHVETLTVTLEAGVHEYQTEAPPALPAWFGSPASLFASLLLRPNSSRGRLAPMVVALAKLSFAGGPVRSRSKPPWLPPLPSTAILYVVPAVALKVTSLSVLLHRFGSALSSLAATWVRPFTAEPVYTPSRVSKLLLNAQVEISTGVFEAGVHEYQTEAPPALPAWFGSPASFVPSLVLSLPRCRGRLAPMVVALAKLSFAGGAGGSGVNPPSLPPFPSAAVL